MHKYKILKDVELVIQYYKDDITLDDIKRLKINLINDIDFNSNFKLLIDIRKARYKLTVKEIEELVDFVSVKLKDKSLKRTAFLTSTPLQVAKTSIYILNKNIGSGHYKIFSTIEAASHWLGIDLNKIDVVSSIINMKKI